VNFILIISDTLRRDHLGCYGNDWISTPNLDALARESIVFDQAHVGSFPTIPHRTDLFTGRYMFTYSDWAPLPRDNVVVAQVLSEAGYLTYFVCDTPHLVRDGFHFDRGFTAWQWIRGQENDRYMTDPEQVHIPCDPEKLRAVTRTITQYLRNVSQRRGEQDYFAPMTMAEAGRWLERNARREPFFLYADTFDPHEPWDPPQHYVDMYDPGYQGEEVIYPIYGPATYLSEAELKHMRALYAGEVTMVDRWVGRLLNRAADLGLLDDTAIIFGTDHGFYLGEHGLTGKVVHLYEEVSHVPLLIRMPGGKGARRCPALVQAPDIMPTMLELAGAPDPGTMHGKSLVHMLEGKDDPVRETAISSWSIIHEPVADALPLDDKNPYKWAEIAWKRKPSTVTDGEWSLICGAQDVRPELYHVPSDPAQAKNVIADQPDQARRLHAAYIAFLESLDTDDKFIAPRRSLSL